MSKFMKPEMEVIRFTEADVIVASTTPTKAKHHTYAELFNWGTGSVGDAYVWYHSDTDAGFKINFENYSLYGVEISSKFSYNNKPFNLQELFKLGDEEGVELYNKGSINQRFERDETGIYVYPKQ